MIEEKKEEVRDGLKEEVTETYVLINNLFQYTGFFLNTFMQSLFNFINFFAPKK